MFKLVALYFLLMVTLGEVYPNCSWSPSKDFSSKDPLFLKKFKRRYHLFQSNSTNIELRRGQVLYATCPGNNNAVNGTDNPSVKISCEVDNAIKINGIPNTINQMSCNKNVAADILSSNVSDILPGSQKLSVGFHTNFGWMSLFNVSYDFNKNTPLYSRHYINGKSLKGYYKVVGNRPNFKSNGISSKISWTTIFTQNHQKNFFESILGKRTADIYLNVTTLNRGHLTPDADFYFNSWQFATYFYANVVPQWQTINGGNWVRIENAIRRVAKDLKEEIEITTGISDILTIQDENGNSRPIYLEINNNVPVPKFIWKIACTKKRLCMSFVILNDPINGSQANICENLCQRNKNYYNWYFSSYEDVKKGLVTCCDVRELMQAFNTVPSIDVNGVLKY